MISLGLIGCGDVAENGHAPAILKHGRFRLAATCDVVRARAELIAGRAGGVPAYADWREMLAREPDLDGVVLALPPEISPAVAIASLDRRLAVLDEKPLATTLADGRRLVGAVAELQGVYQVGFVLRYGNWVEQIRQWTPVLGTPLQISVEVYDERFDPQNQQHLARIQNFLKNSSAMTHEGSHVIDYASLWNASPWRSASAVAQQTSPAFNGPNVWTSQIEFEDRSTLNVKIGWLLPDLPPSTVTLVGPEGRLAFNCVTGRGLVDVDGVEKPLEAPPLSPHWARQYDAFAAAIDRGRGECATVVDGFRALEITAACEQSARTGVAVTPADLHGTAPRGAADVKPAVEVR